MTEKFPHSSASSEILGNAETQLPEAVREKMEKAGGEAFFQERYGLGIEELIQPVEYGEFKGFLIDTLVSSDQGKCPLGDDLAETYAEEGLAGVQEKLTG